MNNLRLSFFILLGTFAVVAIALSIQIAIMQENTRMLRETNDKLHSALNNYTTLFGNVTNPDLSQNVFKLKVKTYVAPFEDELSPTEVVKVGHIYSVTAEVNHSNESFSQPLIHYVLLISIKDQNDKTIVTSWSYKQMLPNESSSYGGIYWTPNSSGNYTIEAFVWTSLTGTPLAESSRSSIHVTE